MVNEPTKREHIGVYVTLVLIGAGGGLLVAAYLDSRIKLSEEKNEQDTETTEEAQQTDLPETNEKSSEDPPSFELEGLESRDEDHARTEPEEQEDPESPHEPGDAGEAVHAEGEEDWVDVLEEDDLDHPWSADADIHVQLAELEEEFEVTAMEHGMVASGASGIDELRRALEDRQADEAVNYTKLYSPEEAKKAPSIMDVVTTAEVVDGVWKISESRAYKKIRSTITVIYYKAEDTLVRLVGGRQVPVQDPSTLIGSGVLDRLIIEHEETSQRVLYLVNTETQKQYMIEFEESISGYSSENAPVKTKTRSEDENE